MKIWGVGTFRQLKSRPLADVHPISDAIWPSVVWEGVYSRGIKYGAGIDE